MNADNNRELYLDLLKKSLLGLLIEDRPVLSFNVLHWTKFRLWPRKFDRQLREGGEDWPRHGISMIGLKRMNNLQHCIETVLQDKVPGDLIETGLWRGGATIFMRGVLKSHGVTDRQVWVADSFAGLPNTDVDKYPADRGLFFFSKIKYLAVSVEQVKENFSRYGLLDEQVHFLKGWFKDTLPTAPIEKLAVIRLDGDLYESTWDGLVNLYPKLSPGGFIIIDDYIIPACRKAVQDYRAQHNITAEIIPIDNIGVYWRKADAESGG